MEVDDFPSSKYSKLNSNNAKQRLQPSKIGFITTVTATATTTALNGGGGGGGDVLGASTRFGRQWQHSSRIIRVSRASGGKDRHSKVWTAKGPRDRRVRLSVNTAIQFYDLQDRLGYDQPSKAVEWLIKAAADSINELPSLSNINFPPDTPRSGGNINNNINNSNCVIESGGAELLQQDQQQQQQLQQVGSMSMSKSGCSSNNSETSKGSGLSLSRSEIRVKARERARERTAKEKDENLSSAARVTVAAAAAAAHNDNVSSMGQTSSFTQLLTAGINNLKDCTPTPSPHSSEQRAGRNMAVFCDTTTTTTPPMVDYCGTTTTGFMGLSSTHSHLGNGPLPHVMTLLPYSGSHEIQHQHQHQHQQLPFFLDHHHPLIQIPNNHNNTPNNAATGGGGGGGGGGDYNLNFSISSASTTSGFNRGTLQSNSSSSPSFLSYLQRFSATDGGGGSSVPFFLGGAPISPIVDNQHYHHHHHDNHQQQYNSGGLHLNYGEGPPRHSDDKGKGKH